MLPKKLPVSKKPAKRLLSLAMSTVFRGKSFKLFKKTKNNTWADLGAKIGMRKTQAKCLVRSGEIPSPRQTSIDKTNDCAMKSERGALVRGSGPPSGQCLQNDQ